MLFVSVMKVVFPFVLPLFLVISCCKHDGFEKQSETLPQLRSRVFAVATEQMLAMDKNLMDGRLPKTMDSDGLLVTSDISWWGSGFYPGSLWMLYDYGHNNEIRALAEKYTNSLRPLLGMYTDHDIGFMINCSFGRAYDATGDKNWLPVIEAAAEKLYDRYSPTIGTIKSWDRPGSNWRYPVIIDSMMNLELLVRAAKQFDRSEFMDVAVAHSFTTIRNHFRKDYSSYHLVDYDPEDGHVRIRQTVQGYSDNSAWARGQSWGLYGFTMMYEKTGLPEFLDQAEAIARYLIRRLPADGVPFYDYDDPAIPFTNRDASAGAIMASALLELAILTKDSLLAARCNAAAVTIIRTLSSSEFLAEPGTNANFLLKHSVGSKPSNSEVDVPLTYADYYFLEALTRLPQ